MFFNDALNSRHMFFEASDSVMNGVAEDAALALAELWCFKGSKSDWRPRSPPIVPRCCLIPCH